MMKTNWQDCIDQINEFAKLNGITHKQIGLKLNIKRPNITRFFSKTHSPSLALYLQIKATVEQLANNTIT